MSLLDKAGEHAGEEAAKTAAGALNELGEDAKQAVNDFSVNLASAVSVLAGTLDIVSQRVDAFSAKALAEVALWRGQFTRVVDFLETISIGKH